MADNNQLLHDKAQEIGIDTAMLEEILELFFDKLPQQIDQMKTAIDTDAFQELHVISHTIKGTASNLFFEKIAKIAADIESSALSQSCGNCKSLFEELLLEQKTQKIRFGF